MNKTKEAIKLVSEGMSINAASKKVGLKGASAVSKALSRIAAAKAAGLYCECCGRRMPAPKS